MSQFKKKITAFTAMLAFLSITGATAMAASVDDVINNTNNIGFSTSDNRLDVNVIGGQHGAVGQVDWNDFSVGKGEHVNFGFSGLSQTVINRVLGGKLSDIQGKITNSCINGGACDSYAATGKVILINPAGVMFGAGSMVDLNSFTVSTFDFKGAQNLRNMTESQMAAYQANVLNKLSPTPEVNGENRVHGSITFDSNYTEAFEEEREEVDSLCGYGYHLLNSILMEEYANTMDPDRDASFFYKESPDTVAHALEYIAKKADLYEEARGNDNEELGEPSPTARASAGYMREDPPKKPNPSTAQKVQFKFMDKEAKSYKAKQQRKEKMEEIKGAASAALEVPKGIKNSIDDSVKEWDSWDDERRRKYIIKPGFRKKAFRNLKLAMLYGATTSYSILMLPITMMVRHYSKQKDRRIRNQLRKELDTELEICKAKIEDAETNGDKKEKYKLMRIKSKLEQERTRVLTNSKYI